MAKNSEVNGMITLWDQIRIKHINVQQKQIQGLVGGIYFVPGVFVKKHHGKKSKEYKEYTPED